MTAAARRGQVMETASGSSEPRPDDGNPRPPRRRRPEPALLLAGLLPAVVVYGIHWRRGYYLDDPFMDALSFDELWAAVGDIRARPIGTVLAGITYLIGEASGRVLSAIILAGTAALAGLLVRRATGARLASVLVGLLVAYPILDWESALYWYAAIQYPMGALLGLAGAHLFLSTLRATSRRSAVARGVASVVLFAAGLATTEVAINFVVLVPGLTFVEALRRRRADRQDLIRSAAVTAAACAAIGGVAAFIYLPKTAFTSARGEFITDPVQAATRIVDVWIPSLRHVAFGTYRARGHADALVLGLENLTTPIVLVVFLVTLVVGGFAVATLYRSPPEPRRSDDGRAALGLLVAAAVLFVMSSWFPAALLSGQGVVSRLLFTPHVALVLAGGAAMAAVELSGATRTSRALTVVALLAVLPLALTVDGYGELFRRRDVRNDQQLAAWLEVLDQAKPLPPSVHVTSFYGSDPLLSRPSPAESTLAGLTETPWALSRLIYERTGRWVSAIGGHPFVPMCLERTAEPHLLRVTTLFNDVVVPVDTLLAAEIQGPRLVMIDGVTFGSTRVEFPLAGRVTGSSFDHQWLEGDGEKICRVYGREPEE